MGKKIGLFACCLLIVWESPLAAQAIPKSWPFKLDAAQLEHLRSLGCSFDARDETSAKMLEARGFSALEYMEAWEDWNRMGLKDRADVEKITVLNFLSMPKNAVFEMRMGEYASVTDYYNSRISGNGMRIAGWVLFGIGAANLVGGLVLVAMGDPCSGMNTSKQTCWTNYQPVMIASFVLGGTGVIVGLPLALVGGNRVKKWAPEGLLDSAPKRDMEQFRRRFQESFLHIETQETAEDALPSVGLGGSGVYLTPGGLKF